MHQDMIIHVPLSQTIHKDIRMMSEMHRKCDTTEKMADLCYRAGLGLIIRKTCELNGDLSKTPPIKVHPPGWHSVPVRLRPNISKLRSLVLSLLREERSFRDEDFDGIVMVLGQHYVFEKAIESLNAVITKKDAPN